MTTHEASQKNEWRTCEHCGKRGPIAIDETDAGDDEMALDARGLVARYEYVCGECLTAAEDHTTTDDANAYWFNGAAYCVQCVECDTPCLGESEIERSIRQSGEGVCGCCKRPFVVEG